MFLGIGYATLSGTLTIDGTAEINLSQYDVYISNITPKQSAGVEVTEYFHTVMMAKVVSAGTAHFRITVVNQSDKTYVFERVIDGTELDIPDAYDGTDIGYSVSGLVDLQEISGNGGAVTFDLTVTNPKGIKTDLFLLKFNFIEKSGTEILPGTDPDPESTTATTTTVPDSTPTPDSSDGSDAPDISDSTTASETTEHSNQIAGSDVTTAPGGTTPPVEEYQDDFLGLVQALLSKDPNCLNNNNMIYDAVMESLTSKKRPGGHAPILHCQVNSVSGGTMSSIAEQANAKLTSDLHFIFEVDPDPQHQSTRLRLYMYYQNDCDGAKEGDEILVYKQIISRGSDGVWFADGTYIGRAEVGSFFGGGNSGKNVWTVNPYSWKAGAP